MPRCRLYPARRRRDRLLGLCAVALLASCAVPETPSDYELNNGRDRVVVMVVDADGKPVNAFDGQLIGVAGYLFSRGAIIMHPGKRRLSRHCPVPAGQTNILDVMPSVEYVFAAGGHYELYCQAGVPAIRTRGTR